jgi:hypothetical protein
MRPENYSEFLESYFAFLRSYEEYRKQIQKENPYYLYNPVLRRVERHERQSNRGDSVTTIFDKGSVSGSPLLIL